MTELPKLLYSTQEENYRKALSLFMPHGAVAEVRTVSKPNISIYTKDAENLIKQVLQDNAQTYYIVMNAIDKACYSRSQCERFCRSGYSKALANYPDKGGLTATSDSDITLILWILLDYDPKRKAGVSSTDAEKAAAYRLMKNVEEVLSKTFGFPYPCEEDSGNGYHSTYAVRLPPKYGVKDGFIHSFLKALAAEFSNDEVEIDTSVFNPARITKLYGTVARKGANTPERPHRQSGFISIPDEIIPVDESLIQKVIDAYLPQADTPPAVNRSERKPSRINLNIPTFDLEGFLDDHHIGYTVSSKTGRDNSTIYLLDECPWKCNHTAPDKIGDAKVCQYADGTPNFFCQHTHCKDKKWQDFRQFYDPDCYSRRTDYKDYNEYLRTKAPAAAAPSKDPNESVFDSFGFYTYADLSEEDKRPPDFIVDNMIPVGMTFISGAPKTRKSFMALQIANAVATGSDFLGFKTIPSDVAYLDLEGSKSRISNRVNQMRIALPRNVLITNKCKKISEGLIDDIRQLHHERPQIRLIIIDTYSRARGRAKTGNLNAYDSDVELLEPVQRMALEENIAVLFIHHDKKGAGMMADSFERLNGTMGISGSADSVLNLVSDGKRFEGKANLEYNPRDAKGGEMKLAFNEYSCLWQADTEKVDIRSNGIVNFCITHAPESGEKGIVFDYGTVFKAAYNNYDPNAGNFIRETINAHKIELYESYGIAVQLGVRSEGKRGIRILNCS